MAHSRWKPFSLRRCHSVEAQKITTGEFGGAPDELTTFEVREVETRTELEAKNVDAYLDQMQRLLKIDGVRFPNNKEMRFSRLEPVMDGSSSTLRAAGLTVRQTKIRKARPMSVSSLARSTVR